MKRLLVLILVVLPVTLLAENLVIDRGSMSEMHRSLKNEIPYAYTIQKDVTKSAPAKLIEVFELRPGDCTKDSSWDDCKNDRERIEITQNKSSFVDEKVWWYGWSFYFPESYQDVSPVKLSIAQIYDEGSDFPAWMFFVDSEGLKIERLFEKTPVTKLLVKKSDLIKKWHNVQMETVFSKTSKGKINIWVDKKQVFTYSGVTIKSNEYYLKYGLYRSFLSRWKKPTPIPTQKIYFSNMRLEKNRKNLAVKL